MRLTSYSPLPANAVPLFTLPDYLSAVPPFRTVVFDCDSTLSGIEGIELLAGSHQEEIARLTRAAMNGEVPLEEVYGQRLEIIRPSRDQVEELAVRYWERRVPGVESVIEQLRADGVAVRIVSGGIRQAVVPFARRLGVAGEAVAAVELRFDPSGSYAGFDPASPLARAGGKRRVLEAWRDTLPAPVMLVGDGATDLEARPAVDQFVAFAGVLQHPAVLAQADRVIRDLSLASIPALVQAGPPAGTGAGR